MAGNGGERMGDLGSIVPEPVDGPGLGDLPESCVAAILSMLSMPQDVARLACTSRAFRDAAHSDVVWEAMLPPNYADVLALASDAPPRTSSKNMIFEYLCNRVLFANGTQEFWLDRATGGVCRSVGARGLRVCWGDHLCYWEWPNLETSRFSEVAYLRNVCWFDVRGELECFLPPGEYTFSWRLALSEERSGGWARKAVKFSLETTNNEPVQIEHFLSGMFRAGARPRMEPGLVVTMFDVGDFVVETSNSAMSISFSMSETDCSYSKSGLVVDGIVIRPTTLSGSKWKQGRGKELKQEVGVHRKVRKEETRTKKGPQRKSFFQ